MTDNQQIVEIMKVLNECCGVYDENGRYLRNKCNSVDCEYWSDENHCCCSYGRKEAEALYNARYRKVDENQIVVDKEEWEDLQGSDEALAKQYTANCILSCELKKAKKEIERLYNIKLDLEHQLTQKGLTEYLGADVIQAETRKETAKDFIFKVESYLGYNADNETFTKKELLLILAEVAKEQFGMEVEEWLVMKQ